MTHEIVLWGIGHTNAHILKMWRMQPLPEARLTCVSNFPIATYSGMLSGVLAGQYAPRQMEIDLVRLCAAARARLIVEDVTGLDGAGQCLQFAKRPPLPFDVLSIGIGSEIQTSGITAAGGSLLPIKPMQTFLSRWEEALETWKKTALGPLNIVVVGGGAAGVEMASCVPNSVRAVLGNVPLQLALVHGEAALLREAGSRAGRLVLKELKSRQVNLHLNRFVRKVAPGRVTLDDGSEIAADIVLLATGAKAPPVLASLDLPHDQRGFLLTRDTLQVACDAPIFAVGDCATRETDPVPKAGVYAVRQGPVLWDNIQRQIQKRPLKSYEPQRRFLKLLNLGDGRALLDYHGLGLSSRWAWKLKDRIDRRFMAMYQDYSLPRMPAAPNSPLSPAAGQEMKCTGCGCKVGASVLARALDRLALAEPKSVQVGLSHRDDAAVLWTTPGKSTVLTVDYFTAPLTDPFLSGRIAALNAVNDAFAMGAHPVAALAMVTLPAGGETEQAELLFQLLAGAALEFEPLNVVLAGGHTIEGMELTIGFTIIAEPVGKSTFLKSKLRPGDVLILTKPLGTGVLLAAHNQAQCPADAMQALLSHLLASNEPVVRPAVSLGVEAATDVSGFGLVNHLLEMLRASGVDAEIEWDRLPMLPYVAELLGEGVESTLAPANRQAALPISATGLGSQSPAFGVLFDPQTQGGLLLGLPPEKARELLNRLNPAENLAPRIIGHVTAVRNHEPTLRLVGQMAEDFISQVSRNVESKP